MITTHAAVKRFRIFELKRTKRGDGRCNVGSHWKNYSLGEGKRENTHL